MTEEKKKRILIVEDEPDVVALLESLLMAEGYITLVALDGYTAIDLARREKPDLIILDVMLPRMDGYKVSRILKFDEKHRHIPIIMVTAKITEKDRKTGLDMGADHYITKPFDNAELLTRIKNALQQKG